MAGHISLLLLSLFMDTIVAVNEDGDTFQIKQNKHSYHIERGLRLTEGVYGVPVPIDNIFEQILSLPTDDQGQNVESECHGGSELSEMDMCLTPTQTGMFASVGFMGQTGKRKRRQASANGFSLWKNGVIPYVFNSTFPSQDRDAILSAMSEWEKATCIRFRSAIRGDTDIVVFRDGRRCSTNIGRIGQEQIVTLAKTCRSKRILVHELGHVIGLIHEHQRHDRDKYVKVLLENVRNMSQERYQFSKLLSGSITDKAVKYDYTSVMHYGRNYFAKSPELTTLQTTESLYQDVIGRAEKPSFGDMETVNRLYKCSSGCPPSFQCDESCYMDSFCICRCPTGMDKVYLNGPGPNRNSLPDSTCEFFANRGECTGNLKNTLRPLCAKTCDLHQAKNTTPSGETLIQAPSSNTNHVQSKPVASSWGTSPDTHGLTGPGRNSFYNHEVNNLNDVTFRRSGEILLPIQQRNQVQQLQGVSSQQQYLQDRQLLPMSGTRDQSGLAVNSQQLQQDIMNAPLTDNLRIALQQRSGTQHSSESSLLQSLIMSSSSSDKTSDIRQVAHQSAGSHLSSLLRQETTKTPTTILEHLLSADSINRHDSFNGLSVLLSLSDVRQQQQRQLRQQQVLQKELQNYYRVVQTVRPTIFSNAERQTLQDIYDLTHLRAPGGLPNGGSNNWQVDLGTVNRNSRVGILTGQTTEIRNSASQDLYRHSGHNTMLPNRDFGVTEQSQKAMEPNVGPITVGADRVNIAVTSADFTGPEVDQSGAPLPGIGSVNNSSSIMGPDSSRNLQTTGPSFMKNSVLPQSYVISEQNPPMGSPAGQILNEPWNLQIQQGLPLAEMQPPGPTFQYYEPHQTQQNFDQFTTQAEQHGEQQQSLIMDNHGTSTSSNQPFVDTLSFQNYQEPIDHHTLETSQTPQIVPNNQYNAPVDSSNSRDFSSQQQQRPQLFQLLTMHQPFTDPIASNMTSNIGNGNSKHTSQIVPNKQNNAPVDSSNSRDFSSQHQQRPQLFQLLNMYQSFTDPLASSMTSDIGNVNSKQTQNTSALVSDLASSQNNINSRQNNGLVRFSHDTPHIPTVDSSGDTHCCTTHDNARLSNISKIVSLHSGMINGLLRSVDSKFLDISAILSGFNFGNRYINQTSGQPTFLHSLPSVLNTQRQNNNNAAHHQNRQAMFTNATSAKK